jgi:ribulose-5-phosphate 4-epimerase/fuculose-1-phosphate aldolase
MVPAEGIIKFRMEFTPAPALPADEIKEIEGWRKVLYLLQVLGQDPARYAGWGFGNISRRLPPWVAEPECRPFVITGTQTGDLPDLKPEHYTVVLEHHPQQNLLVAAGPVRPSSESLTHGIIYALDEDVRWVMHGHSPHIWRHAAALNIPTTDAQVSYGSPEMAAEVARLFAAGRVREERIFAMGGHEDGIVSFGATAEEAGEVFLATLARAFQFRD